MLDLDVYRHVDNFECHIHPGLIRGFSPGMQRKSVKGRRGVTRMGGNASIMV
ncbi:hypothetical protein SERLA73DRAFT_182216 [Serpula lacrymans var. lacrymans S7.3]|uniref:Uncharacterized protein n=2 Tax=Serpula lacrymans var. lacrymans TaxID=341189 RepID=F8PWV6_SERL3|nr:uncharacterized protein SERLADRAFT_468757 [Serpula lacrymans var. lacrymans S7.9]EGN99283.1 hypothetical protein SERLA73DRAFT_182216 [Serpula lacrymans var. lacrymans S7.3]EGO24848.1 hypothetical protein SERLADRAFT_468757 [Serpula lacrymans var. lacrymans S7.9]